MSNLLFLLPPGQKQHVSHLLKLQVPLLLGNFSLSSLREQPLQTMVIISMAPLSPPFYCCRV